MNLSKNQIYFIKKNEAMISSILNNRIENLKDRILDVEPDKRNELIEWIKEYRLGIGLLREICKDNDEKDPTGI